MSIALRGISALATVSGAGTLTISVPTGVVDGDVMVAIVETNGTVAQPTPPAGWTTIDQSVGNNPSAWSWYRVVSSEPASYGWTTGGTSNGMIVAYSGVDNTNPVNAHVAWNRQVATTAPLANSITTTVDGCQLLYLLASSSSTTLTPPPGFATTEATANHQVWYADMAQTTAGATGTATGTDSISANTETQLVALAPASAAPTNTVAPVVSGNTVVGSTLSTGNGTWTGSPTSYTYQWTSGGVNISAATSSTYTTQAGDVGNAIGCTVTATNTGGSASQASSNTITVTAAPSLSTVAGKTGTSGTAVMQKAKSGWTYITGKKNTSGTAVDQKGLGGFTKIKGH